MYANYYKVLNILPGASRDQVKRAYYKLVKKYHPDVNKSKKAHEVFLKIQEAYEVLYEGKSVKRAVFAHKAKHKTHPRNKSYASMKREMQNEAKSRDPYYKNKASSNNEHGTSRRFFRNENSPIGRVVSYFLLLCITLLGAFFTALPLFVLITTSELFLTFSTLLSTFMGVFFLKFSADWYSNLKADYKKKNN